MAKRRRLTPAQSDYLGAAGGLETKAWGAAARPGLEASAIAPPPIAQVAGEASVAAALAEVSGALAEARAEGRLVQRLALDAVEIDYLVRDRLGIDAEEMAALMESIRLHGQRTPIEVTETAPGRYGLISGWRRLTALRQLAEETGEARFTTVLALLRRPETAGAAYVAMVEENEIRLGLSYYERARIVGRAVEQGVFADDRSALQALFAAASRAKRSKIGSFLRIWRALDGGLRFPAAIPERLGLGLAARLDADPAFAGLLVRDLGDRPAVTAEEELARLAAALEGPALRPPVQAPAPAAAPDPAPRPVPRPAAGSAEQEIRPGVFLRVEGGFTRPVLIVSGPAVDPGFRERLEQWLANPD